MRIIRQTIAQGRPVVRLTCGDCRLLFLLQAGHGHQPMSGLPCALDLERAVLNIITRADRVARMLTHVPFSPCQGSRLRPAGARDCALAPCGRGHVGQSRNCGWVRGMPLQAPLVERDPSPNRVRGWAAHALSHKGRGHYIGQPARGAALDLPTHPTPICVPAALDPGRRPWSVPRHEHRCPSSPSLVAHLVKGGRCDSFDIRSQRAATQRRLPVGPVWRFLGKFRKRTPKRTP